MTSEPTGPDLDDDRDLDGIDDGIDADPRSAIESDTDQADDEASGLDDGDALSDSDDADDDEAVWLQEHRLRLAQERASAIAAGRRKAGMAGAAMAGAMLALRDVIEGPPKDVSTVEVEASSDPIDLDSDGFEMTVGEVDVEAPPLERLAPDHHQHKRQSPDT